MEDQAVWNEILTKYRNGELTGPERFAIHQKLSLGEVPRPGQPTSDVMRSALAERMISANPESMSDIEKSSLVGSWLKSIGQDPSGIGYYTDKAEGLDGDTLLKMWQNDVDPGKHQDVLSELDKWRSMDEEERTKNLPTFTKENIVTEAMDLWQGYGLGMRNDATSAPGKRRLQAEFQRRFKNDFGAMRQMYESNITSKAGREFSKAVAETGVWDSNAFNKLSPSEKRLIPGYIRTIKPAVADGVTDEARYALIEGVKDITIGSLEYVSEKAKRAYYATKDLAGDRSGYNMLQAMEETKALHSAEAEALRTKFEERGLLGKATVGIASSLPLMASFFVTGPAGSLNTTGKFGKAAASFNKLVKHMPVAMATVSMAQTHEDLMVENGVNRELAAPVALFAQSLNMYVEKLALDKVLNITKGQLFKAVNGHVVQRIAGGGEGFVRSFAQGYTAEQLEEEIQALNDELWMQFGKAVTKGDLSEFDAKRLLEEGVTTFVEASPTTAAFGLVGGIGGAVSSRRNLPHEIERAMVRDTVFNERVDSMLGDTKLSEEDKRAQYNEIFTEWNGADSETAKLDVLDKYNVRNAEEAMATFEQERTDRLNFVEEERIGREERLERLATFEAEELPKLQEEARAFALEAGIESVDFVDRITDAITGREVGSIANNTIEVLATFADPKQIVRHEVFHKFLEDMNVLTEQEMALLRSAEGKIVSALEGAGLNTQIYEAMEGDKRGKEILADAGAILNEQELTTWQKVGELFTKMKNFVTGKGFKSFRSVLKDAEARGLARAKSAQTTETDGARFAERINEAEQTFQDTAESMAFRIIKGDKVDEERIRQFIPEDAPYTPASVMFEAQAIANNLTDAAEQLGTDAAIRLEVRRVADQRYLERLTKRVERQGVRAGIKAVEQERRVKKRIERQENAAIRAAKSIKADVVKGIEVGEDTDAMFKAVKDAVRADLEERSISGRGTFNAAYKKALSYIAGNIARTMKHDGMKTSVVTRIAQMKLDKTSVEEAEAIAKDVMSIKDRQTEKRSVEDLANKIGRALSTKIGKKPSAKILNINRFIDANTHRYLRMVKKVWGMSEDNVRSAMQEIEAALEGTVATAEGNKDVENRFLNKYSILGDDSWGNSAFHIRLQAMHTVLNQYGALKSKGADAMADALVAIELDIEGGRAQAQLEAKEFRNTVTIIGKLFDRGSRGDRMADKAKGGLFNKLPMVRAIFDAGAWTAAFNIRHRLQDFGRLASEAGREAMQEATDRIVDMIQRGSTVHDEHIRTGLEWLSGVLEDIYGKKFGRGAVAHIEMLTRTHEGWAKYNMQDGKAMSIEQMLQVIGTWEQDDVRNNLKQMPIAGYNQDMIDEMKKEVGPEALQLLERLREFYIVREGEKISDVSMRLFGVPVVVPSENYIPITADVEQLWSASKVHGAPLVPPSLRDRVSHKRSIDISTGVLGMFEDRLRRNANFIAYAETTHILKGVFSNEDLVRQLNQVHGEKTVTQLFNHLTDIVTNSKSGMFDSKILNKARGILGLTALSGNLKVMITQLTSAPAFALERNLFDFTKMIAEGVNDPREYAKAVKAMYESVEYKNRRSMGTSEFVENALRDSLGTEGILNNIIKNDDVKAATRQLSTWVSTLYKKGMATNALGDLAPIMLIGPTIYLQEVRTALQDGLGQQEAEQRAMTRTWGEIQRTQQSYSPKDQAAWIRRGGIIGQLAAQFSTTPAQYLSFETKAIRDLLANPSPENWKKALNVIAVNHVMLGGGYFMVSQLISNFLRGDDWDEEDKMRLLASMLAGPASGMIIFGSMTQDFLRAVTTGKKPNFMGGIVPLQRYTSDAFMAYQLMRHLTFDFDIDKALEDADGLMRDFSAPYRHSRQIEER